MVGERGAACSWVLREGPTQAGRDPTNPIQLADPSVSRHHAEFSVGDKGLTLRDLKSRNGTIVNGVPRQRAALQPGDRIKIGRFELELAVGALPPRPGLPATLKPAPAKALSGADEHTVLFTRLPPAQRELFTLYHVCFWLTDGTEEKEFIARCLRLLLETFQAQEAHFYSGGGELESCALKDGVKPSLKLAAFLAKRFQQCPEAVEIPGASVARHQQRAGQFNYLVGPLRRTEAAPEPAPFLVLMRSAAWPDFTGADRVLMQAICQLWVRGQARAMQAQDLRQENAKLKQSAAAPALLGGSPAMEKLRERARRAAATNLTVLLRGETGSGKEVLAHFIHQNSPRNGGPFVKINCAAIPDTLIESELFGHVKGAFTDAQTDRKGKFARADQGTLFLDEIGEMPLAVQAKVLRAIENGEIEPVGADAAQRVNVRIIAATHRDLRAMVQEKQIREDLFYRLNVMPVPVPALRDHPEDIEVLAGHFLSRFCSESGLAELSFSPEALAELRRHNWPGNVRELRNIVQRCAVACEPPVITPQTVRQELQSGL